MALLEALDAVETRELAEWLERVEELAKTNGRRTLRRSSKARAGLARRLGKIEAAFAPRGLQDSEWLCSSVTV